MSVATERLIVGRGYPHGANAAKLTFNTTATSYAMTNAATYNSTGTTAATFKRPCMFALVSNDDSTNYLTVEVGGSDLAPNTATDGSRRVYPRTQEWIQLSQEGNAILSIKCDTANCVGSINWYPGPGL